jgi:hypothetical protein
MREMRVNTLEKINIVSNLINNKEVYIKILELVKESKINMTKNIRGYWFNINELSEDYVIKLNMYLDTVLKKDLNNKKIVH